LNTDGSEYTEIFLLHVIGRLDDCFNRVQEHILVDKYYNIILSYRRTVIECRTRAWISTVDIIHRDIFDYCVGISRIYVLMYCTIKALLTDC